jgi:tRNA U34 2-thiouridine synthase MnmA/TrmU
MERRAKGIGLVSGGLDSQLAVAVLKRQDIELAAVHFYNGFAPGVMRRLIYEGDPVEEHLLQRKRRLSLSLGIDVDVVDITTEFLDVLVSPRHGYGANANPCIDCRILMLRKAKERMERDGADFIFTGEVLGQRPMSQHRRAMNIVERESGLEGRLVRPLSGKLLPPTIPEKEGKLSREYLLDIRGRSRRRQMELAVELGIGEYTQPAGGCTLTDEHYARRFKDLLEHNTAPSLTIEEAVLLAVGRHFRLSPEVKIVVGREKAENLFLERHGEGSWLLYTVDDPGPTVLVYGEPDHDQLETAAAVAARYSDAKHRKSVRVTARRAGVERTIDAAPALDEELDHLRI